MKLGLLAPEYNGKTSYLVALYAVLTQNRNENPGYPVHYEIKNPVQRRWLNDSFARLVDEDKPKVERFPTKNTGSVEEYAIVVTDKKTKASHAVTIIDFPGELLRGAEIDDQIGKYTAIKGALSSCDAFIVVLDAEYLLAGSAYKTKAKLSPDDINNILSEAMKIKQNEFCYLGRPVVFCISKMDLLGGLSANQTEAITKAYKKIKQYFPERFSNDSQSPAMIAGVSLGEHIAGRKGEEKDPAKLGGPFDPFFIETPFELCFAFCAFGGSKYYEERASFWRVERNSNQARLEEARSLGLLGTVNRWMDIPDIGVGESPVEYYEKKVEASGYIMNENVKKSERLYRMAGSMADVIKTEVDPGVYAIYIKGRRHAFKKVLVHGLFPFEDTAT